jgi:hypothetical protein
MLSRMKITKKAGNLRHKKLATIVARLYLSSADFSEEQTV